MFIMLAAKNSKHLLGEKVISPGANPIARATFKRLYRTRAELSALIRTSGTTRHPTQLICPFVGLSYSEYAHQ